jgi:hypothetical protein
MSKRILICGDSFGISDSRYPELHFSEKISKKINQCKVINLCRGGSSNSLIEIQLHQGLALEPDCVILLFTNIWRNEYEISVSHFFNEKAKLTNSHNTGVNEDIINFNNQKYLTRAFWSWNNKNIPSGDLIHDIIKINDQLDLYESTDLKIIKNYFSILAMLNLLKIKNIPFCFSLGGLDNNVNPQYKNTEYDKLKNKILPDHFLPNELEVFMSQSTDINLWDHVTDHSIGPYFHVEDDAVHTAFADDCITKLGLL